ncbi:MAG: FAD-dependent oxidoreductase, partial [Candidatus Dormibacteraeota bacterium]|nr:FAD-dependent oxidoreductase [Candidatus Dormibacteraeota bacterium]
MLVLGGGFGGFTTARVLARRLAARRDVAIRLVDREDSLTFWPMVPEVIPGAIQAAHVVRALREELVPLGVEFVRTRVIGADLDRRTVRTGIGDMEYDKLVVALGWQTSFFGTPGAAEHCLAMQSLTDAVAIRTRVVDQFEAAVAECPHDLRFIVIGGGSTGVEVVAGISELIDILIPQYPGLSEEEVHLIVAQAKDDLLPHMEEPLRQAAASRLRKDGIELRTDSTVKSVDERGVVLDSGDRLDASTVIWTAGVEPSPIARRFKGARLDKRGRLKVDACLRVGGQSGVYALGDIAAVTSGGKPVPPTAQAAVQEAAAVANNLAAEVTGGEPEAFQYRFMGHLVTLGGRFAVSQVFGARLSGWAGHLLWRG